jgi:hypothetical protein
MLAIVTDYVNETIKIRRKRFCEIKQILPYKSCSEYTQQYLQNLKSSFLNWEEIRFLIREYKAIIAFHSHFHKVSPIDIEKATVKKTSNVWYSFFNVDRNLVGFKSYYTAGDLFETDATKFTRIKEEFEYGLNLLETELKIRPIVFVPPYNEVDNFLIRICNIFKFRYIHYENLICLD